MQNSLLFIILLLGFNAFGQDNESANFQKKQGVYLYVNPLQQISYMSSGVMCDCGQKMLNNFEIGGFYRRQFNSKFSYEVGLEYNYHHIEFEWFPDGNVHTAKANIEILSFPINVNYHFGRYLYIQAGTFFDYQLNDISMHYRNQTGFGATVGVGLQYSYQKWHIFAKPNYKRHAIIALKDNGYNRISELGVQFGVGYVW